MQRRILSFRIPPGHRYTIIALQNSTEWSWSWSSRGGGGPLQKGALRLNVGWPTLYTARAVCVMPRLC